MESPELVVEVVVSERYVFCVQPDWFADEGVDENSSREELWAAMQRWYKADPGDVWNWIDGNGDGSVELRRMDTGEVLT